MKLLLNPSLSRIYLISWESDGAKQSEPEKVTANNPFDALLWWLAGYDENVFATLQDVEIDFNTQLLNSYTVWVGEEEINVRDITEFENADCISCEQLLADRKAERRKRKEMKLLERQAEQAKRNEELSVQRKIKQLKKLALGIEDMQAELDDMNSLTLQESEVENG